MCVCMHVLEHLHIQHIHAMTCGFRSYPRIEHQLVSKMGVDDIGLDSFLVQTFHPLTNNKQVRHMYQTAIEKIKESIFPIFYITTNGQRTEVGVRGTGFFIGDQGHFLTARHVITDAPANSTLQYRGNIPNHIINPPELITEIYRDPVRDIISW